MVKSADNNEEDELNEAVRLFVDAQLRGESLDVDEFVSNYPGREQEIEKRIKNCQQVNFLLDSLGHVEASELEGSTVTDLMGLKLGNFEIVKMIGRGGMGVVYLANDTKLDRSVAIKTMPAELADNTRAHTRFQREAKALASLNHPNIAVIYDMIEDSEGSGYLVLEYIPGLTLAEIGRAHV